MFKIRKAEKLVEKIYRMVIEAPRVAASCQPGQFLIVRQDETGERIPLTIADFDREEGTITVVFQVLGVATVKMASLKTGDSFMDVTGPLGQPSEFVREDIEELKKKKYVFVAGGLGPAPVYPQVKWFFEHGLECDVIIGTKNKDTLIYEQEMYFWAFLY